MSSDSPVHDILLPRLTALLDEAVAAGIARDVAVAVLIDLITSPSFDTAVPDSNADPVLLPLWDRDADSMALPGGLPAAALPTGEKDVADYVRPFGWMDP